MATAKLYLDLRKIGTATDKVAPLKIALNHKNSTVYISLPIQVLPTQWDKKNFKVTKHPDRNRLNAIIKQRLYATEVILQNLSLSGVIDTLTPSALKTRVSALLIGETEVSAEEVKKLLAKPKPKKPKSNRDNPHSFANWFKKFMSHKQNRTREIYQSTYNRLVAWLGEDDFMEVTFEDIRKDWLQDFDEFLKGHAPSPNGRGIHFRNIRAVINDALDNEITVRNGMRGFKIPKAPTRKRNLSVEQIRKLLLSNDLEPWMERYRDFFALSFMLLGMNCKDICELKELHGDRIEFYRSKTSKLFSIKVHPEAMRLIEKYRGNDGYLLNFMGEKQNYRYFYNRLALALPKIKNHLNKIDDGIVIKELTSYWARHSWATIAAALDIPRDTIMAALGHNQHDVTAIYIEFDMKKVDDANRKVIDWIFAGKAKRD